MITQRIDALDIEKRGLFTAVYGVNRTSEIYITADLRVHSLYEALYLYLRQQGYITVFYDDKVFSYEESQLMQFFGFTAKEDKPNTWVNSTGHTVSSGNCRDFFTGKGPMSKTRNVRQSANQLINMPMEHHSHHDAIRFIDNDLEHSYVVIQTEGFFGAINSMVERDAGRKVAVVFVNPNTLEYNENEQRIYENYLSVLRTRYVKNHIGLKLIALYDFISPETFAQELGNGSSKFLMRPPFKDLILNDLKPTTDKDGNAERKEMKTVFFLSDPERDEINNMLNRKRLLDGLSHVFDKVPWEHIVLRLWQGVSTKKDGKDKSTLRLMRDFYQIESTKLDEIIENMNTVKAIDQLNTLQGIDNIKEQFLQYRAALRSHRLGQGGGRFRPHMALMGSPGTGKSTVARLFGDILREDGLLPKGHFVKVDVSELIGEYIGSTRPKTRAVCERARGGVLFIDEAYGLMSGSNDHGEVDYGKEAIEVLIQFMEDSDDSLVILAGYTDEINNLINKGNTGFRRRFNELGFFHFNDYKPKVLFDIAMKMIPYQVTDGFKKALLGILQFKYAYRTKKFGNVGDLENMVNIIIGSYRSCGENGPIDVIHLPENLRILVDSSMLNEETMLEELDCLTGQNEVKSLVRELFTKALANRIRLQTIDGYTPEVPNLNYIFSGNPGTGKTTIARIIGKIMQRLGVLSSADGEIIKEIAGNDLLTASPAIVKELFENSIGKVLIIDEAYQLRETPRVVADIVGNITNKDYENKLCLIMAGYTDGMHQMMNVNAGMQRRFRVVHFSDYTNEELWEILLHQVENPATQVLMDAESCKEPAMQYFASITRDRNFGNAGIVDILLGFLKGNREMRYVKATREQQTDPDFAKRILPEDFPKAD